MTLNKTLISYFYVLFGTSFARGVALFNTIIIARMLGPIHFGVFSIFYVVMILTWQLPQAFDSVFVTYAKKVDSMREKNDILKTSVEVATDVMIDVPAIGSTSNTSIPVFVVR